MSIKIIKDHSTVNVHKKLLEGSFFPGGWGQLVVFVNNCLSYFPYEPGNFTWLLIMLIALYFTKERIMIGFSILAVWNAWFCLYELREKVLEFGGEFRFFIFKNLNHTLRISLIWKYDIQFTLWKMRGILTFN